ncbi:MAG: FecR protein, partial [Planctomycetota bacterium]
MTDPNRPDADAAADRIAEGLLLARRAGSDAGAQALLGRVHAHRRRRALARWALGVGGGAVAAAIAVAVLIPGPEDGPRLLSPAPTADGRLSTGDEGLTLRWDDGVVARLAAGSSGTVSAEAGPRFTLTSGGIHVDVDPTVARDQPVRIQAPELLATVRGTRFQLAHGEGVSLLETLHGTVSGPFGDLVGGQGAFRQRDGRVIRFAGSPWSAGGTGFAPAAAEVYAAGTWVLVRHPPGPGDTLWSADAAWLQANRDGPAEPSTVTGDLLNLRIAAGTWVHWQLPVMPSAMTVEFTIGSLEGDLRTSFGWSTRLPAEVMPPGLTAVPDRAKGQTSLSITSVIVGWDPSGDPLWESETRQSGGLLERRLSVGSGPWIGFSADKDS